MHTLNKTQEDEIHNYITQILHAKSLHLDAKILLIGMAISLPALQFSQILDRVNVIAPKICSPLKSINTLASNAAAVETILNIISKKAKTLDSNELEKKLLSVELPPACKAYSSYNKKSL